MHRRWKLHCWMCLGFCRGFQIGDNSGRRRSIGVEIEVPIGAERGSPCRWIEECPLERESEMRERGVRA